MRTIETTVYTLDELEPEAREKALDHARYWSVDDLDWWDGVQMSAEDLGLEIEAFDINRASFCTLFVLQDFDEIARRSQRYGFESTVFKLARAFILDSNDIEQAYLKECPDSEEWEYEDTDEYRDLTDEYKRDLEAYFLGVLRSEFEHLTSDEVVERMLEDREFTVDGELV